MPGRRTLRHVLIDMVTLYPRCTSHILQVMESMYATCVFQDAGTCKAGWLLQVKKEQICKWAQKCSLQSHRVMNRAMHHIVCPCPLAKTQKKGGSSGRDGYWVTAGLRRNHATTKLLYTAQEHRGLLDRIYLNRSTKVSNDDIQPINGYASHGCNEKSNIV